MAKTYGIENEVLALGTKKLGEYFKGIREHRGMSLEEFAKRMDISVEEAQALEGGAHDYSIHAVLAISAVLECYLYFSDKRGKDGDFDPDHIVKQSKDPI